MNSGGGKLNMAQCKQHNNITFRHLYNYFNESSDGRAGEEKERGKKGVGGVKRAQNPGVKFIPRAKLNNFFFFS